MGRPRPAPGRKPPTPRLPGRRRGSLPICRDGTRRSEPRPGTVICPGRSGPHAAHRARRVRRRGSAGESPAGTYLTVTAAPAASSSSLAVSASSLVTPSRTAFGAPSTTSLASLRPSVVSSRTTLMTWIFLSAKPSRTTSNSVFSSSAAAAPPAGAGGDGDGSGGGDPEGVLEGLDELGSLEKGHVLEGSIISSVVSLAILKILSVPAPGLGAEPIYRHAARDRATCTDEPCPAARRPSDRRSAESDGRDRRRR